MHRRRHVEGSTNSFHVQVLVSLMVVNCTTVRRTMATTASVPGRHFWLTNTKIVRIKKIVANTKTRRTLVCPRVTSYPYRATIGHNHYQHQRQNQQHHKQRKHLQLMFNNNSIPCRLRRYHWVGVLTFRCPCRYHPIPTTILPYEKVDELNWNEKKSQK